MGGSLFRPSLIILYFLFLTFLVCFSIPNLFSSFVLIWILVICFIVTITIHELGHVFFGLMCKLNFCFFAVGPFLIENVNGKVKIRENKNWIYFGGVAVMTPPCSHKPNKKSLVLFLIGGPFFSFLSSIISFALWKMIGLEIFLWFLIFNGLIFLATAIPMTKGEFNDGGALWLFIKNKKETERYLLKMSIIAEMFSSKRPKDWNKDILKQCKESIIEHPFENRSCYTFLFYYFCDLNGMEEGISHIKPLVNMPQTKENRLTMSFFNSLYFCINF
ncbi:hypothetical protein JOD45_002955 [Scopulibacillus daqui]|uniref:Peptidase M50 domain-containing protein n=1 Tax=Scopulibacillus daqui TaxID=1469162 RepID=A0ABS2Q348_9BACL|nr:M50 family metallopeptidase [Scopulibacillus daqui]MBM7646722.1 hypothetical protein [Scopulibacillus daqui]